MTDAMVAPIAPGESARSAPGFHRPWLRTLVWRIVANPRVYDLVQVAVGSQLLDRRLRSVIAQFGGERTGLDIADVGGGTGLGQRLFPSSWSYTLIDNDEQKISGYRAKRLGGTALYGTLQDLPLADGSQHVVLLRAVTHHIADADLPGGLVEVARVLREDGLLVFIDGLISTGLVPRLLWHFDRGSHPRRAATYQRLLSRDFDILTRGYLRGLHRYLICTARPRRGAAPVAQSAL